jgi:hypothetical protein
VEPFYRATLRVERVAPYADADDDVLERTTETAYITVTGGTLADTMSQIHAHAGLLNEKAKPAVHPVDRALNDLYESIIAPTRWEPRDAPARQGRDPFGVFSALRQPSMPAVAFDLGKMLRPNAQSACAICGNPGPVLYEGSTYVCAACNSVTGRARDREERAEPAGLAERMDQWAASQAEAAADGNLCLASDPARPDHHCSLPLHNNATDCVYMPRESFPAAFVEVLQEPAVSKHPQPGEVYVPFDGLVEHRAMPGDSSVPPPSVGQTETTEAAAFDDPMTWPDGRPLEMCCESGCTNPASPGGIHCTGCTPF